MRESRVLRDVVEEIVKSALGFSASRSTLTPDAVRGQLVVSDHLMLPQAVDDLEPMQDASGAFFFTLNFSALDGPSGLQ